MKLCAGQCKYLIALYRLSEENSVVRSVDIANMLSVTRPSVSRMLKCMADMGLINSGYSLGVTLTVEGRRCAETLVRNFDDVYGFFLNILKLSEESARDQSIRFLAVFPEYTVERLAKVSRTTLVKRNKKTRKSE